METLKMTAGVVFALLVIAAGASVISFLHNLAQ